MTVKEIAIPFATPIPMLIKNALTFRLGKEKIHLSLPYRKNSTIFTKTNDLILMTRKSSIMLTKQRAIVYIYLQIGVRF